MGQTALELLGFSDKGERKMNCFLSVWLFFPLPFFFLQRTVFLYSCSRGGRSFGGIQTVGEIN